MKQSTLLLIKPNSTKKNQIGAILKKVEENGFVIEQLKKDTFKIIYSSDKELTNEKMDVIKKEMERYLEPGIKVVFKRELKLKRSKSGKLRQFTSHIKQDS